MQKLQTNAFMLNGANNKNNWTITTLGDQLNAMIVRINGSTGQLFNAVTNNNIIKQASVRLNNTNQTLDLGLLFGGIRYTGTFVSLVMGPIRGFGFNPFAAAGNLNVTASMFGLTIQPDNYCLVHLQPGPMGGSQGSAMSGSNVLFSEENVVKTKYANDFSLSFQNASLAYQYLNSSSALSTTAFNVIGNYVYNGLGKVEIYTKDFTSNYTNVLKPDQSLYTSTQLDPLGDPSSAAWQVDNIAMNEQPTQTVEVRFDQATSKYYFNLDENINSLNPTDRVYFRGVNTFPTELSLIHI